MWLIRAVVYLLAANRKSSCSLTRAMDGRIVRSGIISLRHFRNCKALLARSLCHARSAIASTVLYLSLFRTKMAEVIYTTPAGACAA